MKKLAIVMVGVLMVLCLVVSQAKADMWYLDSVNVNNTGTSGPWATVTLTDSTFNGKDSIHFEVDPIDSAFLHPGTNFGLQSFFFNESTGFGSSLRIGNFDPTGWSYNYNANNVYNAGGGFGKFEFLASGNGYNRANPLSFDVYGINGGINGRDVTIANFSTELSTGGSGEIFAAHIADYNCGNSAKFATDGPPVSSVPEPSTMMLFGSGLLGLAIFGRKTFGK